MRLVISIFDHHTAYHERKESRAFISKSAVAGQDLASLDTYTGLPYELEQEILARYHELEKQIKLPRDIWQDLSTPDGFSPASPSTAAEQERRSSSLNAQAAEFTPGQTSTRKKSRGISETIQPVFTPLRSLDWRFGFIEVDYLEAPIRMNYQQQHPPQTGNNARSPLSPSRTLELPAIFEMRSRSNTGDMKEEPPDEARPKRSPGGGTLDLGFGVIHLYKDSLDDQDDNEDDTNTPGNSKHTKAYSDSALTSETAKPDAGSMVAILGVPSNWSTADFLAFMGDSVDSLHQMRTMRDALPNRYMVLLKFRSDEQAKRFKQTFDGRPYSDMLVDEVCHVVRISSVEITSSPNAPYTFAFPMQGPEYINETEREKGKLELPTCPVCLERMDANVTGLVTVQCSHTFHCMCLKGWTNNNCPVCRYTQGRMKTEKSWLGQQANSCAVCSNSEHLWMCLVCGHVGCGRFSGRHAYAHFEETGHTFAYELDSQRVWDYAGDQYVHRLIQSKTDGKLVELPSGASSGPGHKHGPHGAAGDEIAKIEAISIEFSDLLTTQLDSQRAYYAEKVNKLRDDLISAQKSRKRADATVKDLQDQLGKTIKEQEGHVVQRNSEAESLRAKLKLLEEDTLPNLEKDRNRLEKKLEKATDLSRSLHKELDSERSVTRGLMDNIRKLKEENEKRKSESTSLQDQVKDLHEQVQDLMFTLTAQARIKEEGGAGGDVQVQQKATPTRRRKK